MPTSQAETVRLSCRLKLFGCLVGIRHANLVSEAHSVAGCRPIKNKTPTASYVSKLPTKQWEFYFLHGL